MGGVQDPETKGMKRALVITYYWPPSGGAGVQRWLKFTKYLRRFGWEPVIYTPENPEYPETDPTLEKDIPEHLTVVRRPIREPYQAYKRVIGRKKEDKIAAAFLSETKQNALLQNLSVWIRGNLFIPDARALWIRPSVKFLDGYLRDNPVDAVISTGPPHSMHLIAMDVAERLNLPWLADFRDPWTNIDFYKDLRLTRLADRRHRKLEQKVLSKASAVTVVGTTMAEEFWNIVNRQYSVITNGFDPDDSDPLGDASPDPGFSIAHIGTMSGSRNPLAAWQALEELVSAVQGFGHDLRIKLVGKVDYTVIQSLEQHHLTPFLDKIDYMPHSEVVRCQKASRVLLLIINNTPNAKTILTGKFFEYLSARRPILCLGPPDGDAASILSETQSGQVADFEDVARVKEIVMGYYDDFKAGRMSVVAGEIQKYSRIELTRQLAALLDSLVS